MKSILKYLLPVLIFSNFAKGEIIVPLGYGGDVGAQSAETALLGFHNYLEHALTEYNRYYANNCYCKTLDLQIVPFYRYLKLKSEPVSTPEINRSFSSFGALAQAQLNFRNFWLRCNVIFGNLKSKIKGTAVVDGSSTLGSSTQEISPQHKKVAGVDDAILKLGYNFYCSDKYNFGVYLLAGAYEHYKTQATQYYTVETKINAKAVVFESQVNQTIRPKTLKIGNVIFENSGKVAGNITVNRHKLTEELNSGNADQSTKKQASQNVTQSLSNGYYSLIFDSPNMGGFNHKIGAGINGAIDLYECDCKELTFLFDAQYYYAIPKKIETIGSTTFASSQQLTKSNLTLEVTPGHTISFWGALHYAYNCYHVEVGGTLYSTFKSKIKSSSELSASQMAILFVPRPVKFGISPYLAASYNTVIRDCFPASIGAGIGYEYANIKMPKDSTIKNKFNGFNAWVSAAISF